MHGPVSADEIRRLVAEGDLQPEDLLWREGMADWRTAGSIKGLFPRAAGKQPPELPPLPNDSPVGRTKSSGNKMLRMIGMAGGGILLLMFLCCGLLGVFVSDSGSTAIDETTSMTSSGQGPDLTDEFFSEFPASTSSDEFLGGRLTVSGQKSSWHPTDDGVTRIGLSTSWMGLVARCEFSDPLPTDTEVSSTDYFTITGTLAEADLTRVVLEDCRILAEGNVAPADVRLPTSDQYMAMLRCIGRVQGRNGFPILVPPPRKLRLHSNLGEPDRVLSSFRDPEGTTGTEELLLYMCSDGRLVLDVTIDAAGVWINDASPMPVQ